MSDLQDKPGKKKRDVSDAVKDGAKFQLIIAGAVPMDGEPVEEELGTLERPNPDHPARHKIREGMACTPKGEAKSTYANVLIMLQEDPAFAELRSTALGGRPYLGDERGQLDDMVARVAVFAQRAYGMGPGAQVLGAAITAVATKRKFYPPREYLLGLEPWDGVARLHDAPWHLMSSPSEDGIVGVFFRRWMIGAVARMMQPGCKMENVIVLQGAQGAKKTSVLQELFGKEWTLSDLPEGKDGMMQIATCWLMELGELVTFNRRTVNELKAWFSQERDTFRRPFAADVSDTLRHTVFAGTTNQDGILTDPTGSRRYWVIPVGRRVDLEAVRALRGQLWAEALAAYNAGEQWWLTEEEDSHREVNAKEWTPPHPWEELVRAWLYDRARDLKLSAGDAFHFTMASALQDGVKIPPERMGDYRHTQAMDGVLKRLGAESRIKTPKEIRASSPLPERTWRWVVVAWSI